jgi:hypothetical protein
MKITEATTPNSTEVDPTKVIGVSGTAGPGSVSSERRDEVRPFGSSVACSLAYCAVKVGDLRWSNVADDG